jgi:hypothetical protein
VAFLFFHCFSSTRSGTNAGLPERPDRSLWRPPMAVAELRRKVTMPALLAW